MRKKKPTYKRITRKAVRLCGVTALSREIKRTRQAIYMWQRVPDEFVNTVSKMSGIPEIELRPDIFKERA